MPSKKHEPDTPEIGVRYVTIADVLKHYQISERTLLRWINTEKRLPAIRDIAGHIRMDLEDVKRVMKARNVPPNPLYEQVQSLQTQVKHLEQRIEEHERLINDLRQHILELTGRNEASQQLLAALTSVPNTEEGDKPTTDQIRQQIKEVFSDLSLLLPRARAAKKQGLEGMLEKRHLPAGTLRLIDFAETHQVKVWDVKQLYWSKEIQLEVLHREGEAIRNKQEWWITTEQHRHLADYWRAHGIAFTACPLCEVPTEAVAG